jgi:hypothetical protein
MKKLLYAIALTAALATPAYAINFDFGGQVFSTNANTDALVVGGPVPAGNQPENIQCIICGTTQPQQDATFGYNNYQQGGNITEFLASSTAQLGGVQLDNNTLGTGYTKLFLLSFLAGINSPSFNIGVDVNTAAGQGAEVLQRFAVVDLANHVILADTGVINMSLPTLNNGTGFPDYTISGFNLQRGDILPGANIAFLANWSNTSDGAESFFIVPQAVPGPIAGAGLPGILAACVGLWGLHRRRKTKVLGA